MGRPTFKIDQTRLRALREEQGLTQTALARRVAQRLGAPESDSLPRHYQRVEENGQTSVKYAQALATILGVSVALLQGQEDPEPYDYLQNIQRLLQQQLVRGNRLLNRPRI